MKETKRDLTLRMLTEAGRDGVTSRQFMEAGNFRFSARIEELRKEGREIETRRIKGSLYRYCLLDPADPEPLFQMMPPARSFYDDAA